jgi:formylglycine-generating enzyme required for sulfatase activity
MCCERHRNAWIFGGWALGVVFLLRLISHPPPLWAQSVESDWSKPRWVRIPAGSFWMGCVPGDRECRANEHVRHQVEISRPFSLTATEITVAQYDVFARARGLRTPRQPLWSDADRHPVVNVTWTEAAAVCEGVGGRLPTEAEWEYAARGGVDGRRFPWGDRFDHRFANAFKTGGLDRWHNSAPVASFQPNAFGLYDMAGSVWEWTADSYEARFAANPVRDPTGPTPGARRVIRGGSWDNRPQHLRASSRESLPADGRYNLYVGVRCAR